jgi:hypothetical protein
MEENERFLKALKSLIELKEATTDEILKSASKEELEKYISLSEEIEAKLKTILGE